MVSDPQLLGCNLLKWKTCQLVYTYLNGSCNHCWKVASPRRSDIFGLGWYLMVIILMCIRSKSNDVNCRGNEGSGVFFFNFSEALFIILIGTERVVWKSPRTQWRINRTSRGSWNGNTGQGNGWRESMFYFPMILLQNWYLLGCQLPLLFQMTFIFILLVGVSSTRKWPT